MRGYMKFKCPQCGLVVECLGVEVTHLHSENRKGKREVLMEPQGKPVDIKPEVVQR